MSALNWTLWVCTNGVQFICRRYTESYKSNNCLCWMHILCGKDACQLIKHLNVWCNDSKGNFSNSFLSLRNVTCIFFFIKIQIFIADEVDIKLLLELQESFYPILQFVLQERREFGLLILICSIALFIRTRFVPSVFI